MGFLQWLEGAVTHIKDTQARHVQLGQRIRTQAGQPLNRGGSEEMPEKNLTYGVEKRTPNGKIGGVDSGFAAQSFYALDLMMLRTVGVCFTYENGKMVRAEYEPASSTLPEPIVNTQGYEREEFHKFVSLTRLQAEIETGITLIEKMKPSACFMDGCLIPHPMDKPPKESKLNREYEKTIEMFTQLYQAAEKNDCLLIGAVEDSRSTRLSEWIRTHMGVSDGGKNEILQDAALLDNVLNPFERSTAFPLAENGNKHPVLNDFPSRWGQELFACYVKPSKWDYPLRIEFLSTRENVSERANRAAEIACAQSSLHKEYAFPSVLIEADLRAGLKPTEVEMVGDKLLSKLGTNSLRARRRDRRPF